MRDQNLNTFYKGIDSDSANPFKKDGYYNDSENVRIIQDSKSNASEQGIAIVVNGNQERLKLTHSFNTRTIYGYVDGVYTGLTAETLDDVPCTVIGHTSIRNTLILFAVAQGESKVTGEFDIETYNYNTSLIFKVDLNNFKSTLVYENESLNFNKNNPIQAIGRYESAGIQRIYWTDGVNTVKTLNIADPNVFNIGINQVSLVPSIDLPMLEIKNIITGGQLEAGVYQYAYRLKSTSGQETKFTIFTNPISVVAGEEYWKYVEDPEGSVEKNGTAPGEITNRSVSLHVSNVNQNYDLIEFLAIYRVHGANQTESPVEKSYIFNRSSINSTTIDVVHSNSEPLENILLAEATSFEINLASAKTIATKDNRLFLGGISQSTSDLEFNARTYRYKRNDSLEVHYPYKSLSTTKLSTYVNSPDSIEVESSDQDAINPFNNLNSNNLNSTNKYKYQKNGVLLGGEGPFVKYTFTKQKISGDTFLNEHPDSPPFISSENVEVDEKGFAGLNGKGDYKSGVISALYRGYQRDEVYRFGIVLYNKQGSPGYVNWVGDIRFPSVDDIYLESIIKADGHRIPLEPARGKDTYNFSLSQTDVSESGNDYYLGGSGHKDLLSGGDTRISDMKNAVQSESGAEIISNNTVASEHYLYALGIEFTVNIPESLKDKVSGYSVVRVKREQKDKTVLGVGLLNYYNLFRRDAGSVTANYYNNDVWLAYGRDLDYMFDGGDSKAFLHHGNQQSRFWSVDSPDFIFSQNYPSASSSDYFQIYGGLTSGGAAGAYGVDNYATSGFHRKYYSHLTKNIKNTETPAFIEIDYTQQFKRGNSGGIINSLDVFPDLADALTTYAYNFAYENRTGYQNQRSGGGFLSIGEETLFAQVAFDQNSIDNINYEQHTPEFNTQSPSFWRHYLHKSGNSVTSYSGTGSGTQKREATKDKLLVAWRRDLGNDASRSQYGGSTKDARSNSVYISTGHYTSNLTGEPQKVFGGDTYVTFYDIEKTNYYKQEDFNAALVFSNSNTNHPQTTRSYSFAFPVETTINTTLRTGWHYANKDDFRSNGVSRLNQFEYNDVYSSENDINKYIPKPNYIQEASSSFDNRILYSNIKQNAAATDAWRTFTEEGYKDLDGNKGGITKLINFKDSLYFIQSSGFGVLSISPTSTVIDTSGTSIVLGKGDTIQDFKYISNTVGTSYIKQITTSEYGIYFASEDSEKIYSFRANGLEPLSDIKNCNYFIKGLFSKGGAQGKQSNFITAGFDFKTSEVLFSNENLKFTYAFNERINEFITRYSYYSDFFINTFKNLFTTNSNVLYEHNSIGRMWNNEPFKGSISFTVNKYPTETKIFDSLEYEEIIDKGVETMNIQHKVKNTTHVSEVNFYDEENVSAYFPYVRVVENTSKVPFPRTPSQTRLRSKNLIITLRGVFKLIYVKTLFRISRR